VIGWDASPRHSEHIRRTTGQDEIVPPGLIIELDPPDMFLMKRVFLASGRTIVAALAGNTSHVQLFNPVGSNMLVTIWEQWVLDVAQQEYFLCRFDTALGTLPGAELYNDFRMPALAGGTAARIRTAQQAAAGLIYDALETNVSTIQPRRTRPVVLGPGTGALLRPAVINYAIEAGFVWSQRPARAEELEPA
jgi:hypothetical protein